MLYLCETLREGLFSPRSITLTQPHLLPRSHLMPYCTLTSPYLSIVFTLSYSFTGYFSHQMGGKCDCPLLWPLFMGSTLQCLKLCKRFTCTTLILFILMLKYRDVIFLKDAPTVVKLFSLFAFLCTYELFFKEPRMKCNGYLCPFLDH